MKPSPLELRGIRYNEASFKVPAEPKSSTVPAAVRIASASVMFSEDGNHIAEMRIENAPDFGVCDYQFHVEVVAWFGLDAEVACREYRAKGTAALVPVVAVNMSRILFASAREFLALVTSRATAPALMIDSILLEPGDIEIGSDLEPADMLATVFRAPEAEVDEFRRRWATAIEEEGRPDLHKPHVATG